jgi:hypothetical protein
MAINLEMMKQLLAEFSEKEALTTEEIRAVQQQTKELEQRILQCQERLKLVSEDRVRINEMMQRYAGVNGGTSARSLPSPSASTAPPPVPKAAAPAPGPAPAVSKPAVAQAPPPAPTVSSPPPSAAPAQTPNFFEDMPPPPPPKAPEAPVPFTSALDLVSSLATESSPPAPAPAAPAAPAPAPEPPAAAEEHDEHGDDTVKSINDALRGLFR